MGNYNTLIPQAGYLSNVRLRLSAANGVTQADLDRAAAHARATIDAALAPLYDAAGWDVVTPPLVERVADMLSSAEVLEYKYQRGDTADGEDSNLPSVLKRDAALLLEWIAAGRVELVAASGGVIARNPSAALPSARVAGTEFFPADASPGVSGRRTGQNLETLYRERNF